MTERSAKQVIVMRKDLGMRKGKMIAQGAHASLGVVFLLQADAYMNDAHYSNDVHEAWQEWYQGTFTKICVSVNSEQELMAVYEKANTARLPVKLITDAGQTEFHGVPTKTCLAIGPGWADDIDKITKDLPLL